MPSEFSPPLTRLDAVLWFLRVQLWLSVVALITSFIQPITFLAPISTLRNLSGFGLAILVLLLFPRVLATSSLGKNAIEPLASPFDLRFLLLRCVGLTLFVQTLGWAVIYSCYVLYSLVPTVSSAWLFGSGMTASYTRFEIASTAFRFLLGFFLAFGPAIRDNFRSR